MRRRLTSSLVIRETQLKSLMRYHFTSTSMAIIETRKKKREGKKGMTSVREDVEK